MLKSRTPPTLGWEAARAEKIEANGRWRWRQRELNSCCSRLAVPAGPKRAKAGRGVRARNLTRTATQRRGYNFTL